MIKIRKYEPKDKENLRKICIATSSLPVETEEQRKFLTLMYNDYYSEAEPDNCFVAVNDEDEAVGYIISSIDYDGYNKIFSKFYLPEIKALGMKYYIMAKGEMLLHGFFKSKYPAHLHIDILDICQGQGVGTRLMNALCEHLKENGVSGLMLSCGATNTKAIKFYKKNSFVLIKNILGSCIMAKKL